MTAISMSRRQALLGTAAMAGTATLGALPMSKALAKAPLAKDQAPYFYRFTHGKTQATVVSGRHPAPRRPLGKLPRLVQGRNRQDADRQLLVAH